MSAARDKKPGFDSEFTGTALRVKLRGEIDHHSAIAVRSAIDDMIKSKRPHELIIDMSAVDFMDSSGLGLIMGRYAVMKEIGGETFVSDPNPGTERIMRLAGMERIIKVLRSAPERREQEIEQVRSSATASLAHESREQALCVKERQSTKRRTTGGERR